MQLLAMAFLWAGSFAAPTALTAADGSRFAHNDSDSRYIHQIQLYDANNRRIEPDSTTPYSSLKTCGRCHDYETISHGWHFNAFLPETADGRAGEPWIWTDPRTGTQLPLSYRQWSQSYDPRNIGIDQWAMVRQFGGRIPGGGLGHAPQTSAGENADQPPTESPTPSPRWAFSGSLEIDCLACHGVSGSYDFNARREQIAEENFAWAATAGLKLGSIEGSVSRIKDDADPEDASTQQRLPKVAYDPSRFASDGTVFVDVIRKPQNNACYQCHSQRLVTDDGIESSIWHDQDVHLLSGMQCVDCHRNGIDHHIVRGSETDGHPSDRPMVTLTCAGCHLGADFARQLASAAPREAADEVADGESPQVVPINQAKLSQMAGRLGSPKPLHAGLPPLHFEKLSCTACHGGPLPRERALGVMTSLAHSLGEKGHRTGSELPRLAAPVYAKASDDRIAPHRVMWPAFWGEVTEGDVKPLNPDQIYDVTRRALRVRKDFRDELVFPELKSSQLKEILGEDRYRVESEQWTAEEAERVRAARDQAGRELFAEKVGEALQAIEEEFEIEQAAYVSAGHVYVRSEDGLTTLDLESSLATDMRRWPMAHNVRPAGWSLGITGCTECHSDQANLFAGTVSAEGPGPDRGEPISMATIQGLDPDQRLAWNQLFANRASFKYVIATSLVVLLTVLLVAVGLLIGRSGRSTSTQSS